MCKPDQGKLVLPSPKSNHTSPATRHVPLLFFCLGFAVCWSMLIFLHLWIPALIIWYIALGSLVWFFPGASLWVLIIGLVLHSLTMSILYHFGLPPRTITALAAWKEILLLLLLLFGGSRLLLDKEKRLRPNAADIVLALFGLYLIYRCLDPRPLHHSLISRLYGLRLYGAFICAYFAGRFVRLPASWIQKTLILFLVVGTVSGAVGIVERFFIPLQFYITPLGYVRYLKDVAHITYSGDALPASQVKVPAEVSAAAPARSSNFFTVLNRKLGIDQTIQPGKKEERPFWAEDPAHLDLPLPPNFHTSIGHYAIRRAASLYLNPQPFAISFLLVVPLALIATWSQPRRRGWWLPYIFMGTGLLLTLSRGPIVSLLIALACGGIYLLQSRLAPSLSALASWNQSLRSYLRNSDGRRRIVIATLLTASAIAVCFGLFHSLFAHYVGDVFNLTDHSFREHIQAWEVSLLSFSSSPLTGVGLGTGATVPARFGYQPLSQENQWLILLSETGLIGLLLYFGFLGFILRWLHRVWLESPEKFNRLVALGLVMALVGVICDGLTAQLYDSWFVPYLLHFFLGLLLTVTQTPLAQVKPGPALEQAITIPSSSTPAPT